MWAQRVHIHSKLDTFTLGTWPAGIEAAKKHHTSSHGRPSCRYMALAPQADPDSAFNTGREGLWTFSGLSAAGRILDRALVRMDTTRVTCLRRKQHCSPHQLAAAR